MISLDSSDNSFSSKTTIEMSNVHTGNTPTTHASTALPEDFYEWVKNIAVHYRYDFYLLLINSTQTEKDHQDLLTKIVASTRHPAAYKGFDRFKSFIPDSLYREIEDLYLNYHPVGRVGNRTLNRTFSDLTRSGRSR